VLHQIEKVFPLSLSLGCDEKTKNLNFALMFNRAIFYGYKVQVRELVEFYHTGNKCSGSSQSLGLKKFHTQPGKMQNNQLLNERVACCDIFIFHVFHCSPKKGLKNWC
jgi:hypothetical protein